MRRSDERIMVTHSGSLPRSQDLARLYGARSRGEDVSETELEELGRQAQHASVRRQLAVGVDIGNDGEARRESYFTFVQNRLSGFGGSWERPPTADADRYPLYARAYRRFIGAIEGVTNITGVPMAVGPVRHVTSRPIEDECAQLRACLDGATEGAFTEAFMTAPSPGIVVAAMKNAHYASDMEYLAAVGAAMRVEYETIVDNGFVLQLDCPDLALERHRTYKDRSLSEFLAFASSVVRTINEAIENIPRDRVRMHVCWGNYEGPHDCDLELEAIVPVLREADVGGFVLPFANPRHAHEHKVLSDWKPDDDQIVVAGVIDTQTNYVEHPEGVADRLVRIAESLGDPTRVLAGTDCGFESAAGGGRVADDVVWAKLSALSDGARIASTRLFG
ncbi:MAG: hypothetical protein GEV10_15700 [Streptosporangiales bacterium]|nr:hypothetical protein [Streptosporangiales bacterium]